MKTIISEKRLRAMLEKKMLKENADINDQIVNIKNSSQNISLDFAELHNLTIADKDQGSVDITALASDVESLVSYGRSSWSDVNITGTDGISYGLDRDEYFYYMHAGWPASGASMSLTQQISSLPNLSPDAYKKLTPSQDLSTNLDPLERLKDDLISGAISYQQALNFLEDSANNEADGQEIFAALMFANYLDSDVQVTPAATKGMDGRATNGQFTIEVKGSTKDEPQTQFSGTLPKNSKSHFYLFLATDRSYLIRSDILRKYYFLPDTSVSPEEYQDIFFRKHLRGPDSDEYTAEDMSSLQDFLVNLDLSDEENPAIERLAMLKTKSKSSFLSNMENQDRSVQVLYAKILSEIESQTESLAATLLQSLLGFTGAERVTVAGINVGGSNIYLRPVLKGRKSENLKTALADELSTIASNAYSTRSVKGTDTSSLLSGIDFVAFKTKILDSLTKERSGVIAKLKKNYDFDYMNKQNKITFLNNVKEFLTGENGKLEDIIIENAEHYVEAYVTAAYGKQTADRKKKLDKAKDQDKAIERLRTRFRRKALSFEPIDIGAAKNTIYDGLLGDNFENVQTIINEARALIDAEIATIQSGYSPRRIYEDKDLYKNILNDITKAAKRKLNEGIRNRHQGGAAIVNVMIANPKISLSDAAREVFGDSYIAPVSGRQANFYRSAVEEVHNQARRRLAMLGENPPHSQELVRLHQILDKSSAYENPNLHYTYSKNPRPYYPMYSTDANKKTPSYASGQEYDKEHMKKHRSGRTQAHQKRKELMKSIKKNTSDIESNPYD